MASPITVDTQPNIQLERGQWARLGLVTAIVSIVAVLIVQALAIALWPEIALFAPLDNYVRTVVFTLVPVMGATALLAWLMGRSARPVRTFIQISVVVLLLSVIPDYALPVPHKTLLASSVTAFLHVVAGVITVPMLVAGYQRRASQKS
jgi:hypothetical protein